MAQEIKAKHIRTTAAGPPVEKKDHRVFLNDHGEGTFICPACDKAIIKDLNEFVEAELAVRLRCKCSCGNTYRVLVERRQHFRKAVNLVGMFLFQKSKTSTIKGMIRVRDISQSGVQFTVSSLPEFDVGDKLIIDFTLDDRERSQIRERGIVQRIRSSVIGLKFETTDHYGKLGRYLFR